MLQLIWKDLMIQKKDKTMLISVILSFVSAAVLPANPAMAGIILLMGVYLMVVYANAYDYKYQGEILINSLPVARKQVVLAKYLAAFAFAGYMLAIIIFVGIIMNITGWELKSGLDLFSSFGFLIVALFLLCIYLAVYFPLYFKLGYQKSRWANFITLFSLYGVLWFLGSMARTGEQAGSVANESTPGVIFNVAAGQGDVLYYGLLLGLGFVFLFVSMRISVNIYQKKEF